MQGPAIFKVADAKGHFIVVLVHMQGPLKLFWGHLWPQGPHLAILAKIRYIV